MMWGMWFKIVVTTGSRAVRKPCFHTTAHSGRPLARAVRM